MEETKGIALFEGRGVRKEWDPKQEKWFFSIVDIVGILSNSKDPRNYWKVLKSRLNDEGSELVTKCNQLKMKSSDGKYYSTDAGDLETILRLVQSVPSPNAEPLKLWLARLGSERLEEIQDPELAIDRAKATYEKKGYPKDWIDKRMRGINVRHSLTDEWKNRGAKKGQDFAILTDEIYKGTFEMTTREYKKLKSLGKENNLRDHMNDIELILTMLGEAATTKLTQDRDSKGIEPLQKDAKDGGRVAGRTRKDIEKQGGKKVISTKNNS
ncbi:MAG: hypothetical protein V4697_03290 [Patescibacteria group bacterium]